MLILLVIRSTHQTPAPLKLCNTFPFSSVCFRYETSQRQYYTMNMEATVSFDVLVITHQTLGRPKTQGRGRQGNILVLRKRYS